MIILYAVVVGFFTGAISVGLIALKLQRTQRMAARPASVRS
jgi:glycerol-3-phosphate acyltransferase PlsY